MLGQPAFANIILWSAFTSNYLTVCGWIAGFKNWDRPRATGYQPTEFKGSLPKRCWRLGLGQNALSRPNANSQKAIGVRPSAFGGFGTHAPGTTCLTQRSRGIGHGVVVSKICYNAVFVLSVVLCDCCKPMNNSWEWAFSNSGLEVGLPAFQLLCLKNVTHSRKEIYATCLCKECIPAIPFWNSKHPLAARSRFLRAAVRSAIWLHHAHPFVAAAEKNMSHAEKQRVWWRSCVLQDLLYIQWLCSQLCYVTAANPWTIVEI